MRRFTPNCWATTSATGILDLTPCESMTDDEIDRYIERALEEALRRRLAKPVGVHHAVLGSSARIC